jgi:hypothetical protein
MMHCTMDDLLALRAGEASVWARRHAEECATCRAELDALYQRVAQLKALPALHPPRDRWAIVRQTVRTERNRRRRTWGGWGLAAAAALAGALLVPGLGSNGKLQAELSMAKNQSATLQDQVDGYDVDGRVLTGRMAAKLAELEDRIAVIDSDLERRGTLKPQAQDAELQLWKQRVDLMRQLVNVRISTARYVGL